jgi:hypothetical protein
MPELGSKSLLLLTPHALLARHREIKPVPNRKLPSHLLVFVVLRAVCRTARGELSPVTLPGYGPRVLHYQHALQDVPTAAIVAQQHWCNQPHSSWILDLLHGRGLMCGSVSQDRNCGPSREHTAVVFAKWIWCTSETAEPSHFYCFNTRWWSKSNFSQEAMSSQGNTQSKEQCWRYHDTWLQTILQSSNNKNSMVLAQKQTWRPVEQNTGPIYEATQL